MVAVLTVVTGSVALFSWTWALGVAVVLGFAGAGLLIAHYQRASEEALILHAQDLQDLQFIQSAIAPRRPLPYFTRWSSSPALAARLIAIVQENQPKTVLELGSGVSTVVMALAAEAAGTASITSLDHDPVYADKTRHELRQQGLSARAEVKDAPLVSLSTPRGNVPWYDLSVIDGLSDIDLLIVDGPPRKTCADARLPAFELLRDRLSPGAIVVLDDTARRDEAGSVAAWSGQAASAETVPSRKGVTVFRMPT